MLVHRLPDMHIPEMLPVRDATPILRVPEGGLRPLPLGPEHDHAKFMEDNGGL